MTCNSCIHFGICRLENETPARCQHFMKNIVRCKDCVYNKNDSCENGEAFNVAYNPAWFCADGEKP